MIWRNPLPMATAALMGVFACSAPSTLVAQSTGNAGPGSRARSASERVNTEAATPPPINSDYRRAAEGTLPIVPNQSGVPAGGAIDPAARPLGAPTGDLPTTALVPREGAIPMGADVAMLIEHAVEMGIDGTMLMNIAAANKPEDAGNDSVKALMTHAQDEINESKQLLAKAGAAGGMIDANSPVRRFYAAANNYLSTLAMCSTPGTFASPNDKAQLTMINHAVKAAMDGGHIAQFGAGMAPSPSLDPLLVHGRMMKDEGMKTLDQMAGTTPVDPSSPPSTAVLAQRGRDLIQAAGMLGAMMPGGARMGNLNGMTGGANNQGLPNPGRLQDLRPEIIGGTYGTGSPTAGTATGAEAAANVRSATEGPNGVLNVPTPTGAPGSGPSGYGVGNNNTPPTNSNAGARPR